MSTINQLVHLAHAKPEHRAELLEMIRKVAAPQRTPRDFAADFDKPGMYRPVKLVMVGLSSGRIEDGYLRDDEIAEGKQGLQKTIRNRLDWNKKYHDAAEKKSGELYGHLTDLYKTDAALEKFLDEQDDLAQRLQRARSLADLKAALPPAEGLAESDKGEPLVIGYKGVQQAFSRWVDAKYVKDYGPAAMKKLVQMGIQFADKPGLTFENKDTQKALALLKRRIEETKAEVARQRAEIEKGIEAAANEIRNALKTQFPGADWERLPSVSQIMGAIGAQ